jgi:hypothetical protein
LTSDSTRRRTLELAGADFQRPQRAVILHERSRRVNEMTPKQQQEFKKAASEESVGEERCFPSPCPSPQGEGTTFIRAGWFVRAWRFGGANGWRT